MSVSHSGAITAGQVLHGVELLEPLDPSLAERPVAGLDYDSRRIREGWLFFAMPGAKEDGRRFVDLATEAGALAAISHGPPLKPSLIPYLQVANAGEALAIAAANFYAHPDQKIAAVGVTGTNGKTTISWLVDAMLRANGATTALVGTIHYNIAGQLKPAPNTTPDSLLLNRLFSELISLGGTHAVMEVSSHGLALGRVWGLRFHTAIFSNLSRDHLDFHGTMEAYFEAKHLLFQPRGCPPPQGAVINTDDSWGRKIRTAEETRRITYGIDSGDVRAENIQSSFEGLSFEVKYPGGTQHVRSALVGRFNVYNLLAAFGAGLSLGLLPEAIAAGLESLPAVPGRFERVSAGQPFLVVVDYAHTPDAMENLIKVARSLSPKRVITVFGCGGDRDRTKRPMMAEAAASLSDFVVLTSDNPRSEDPLLIINDALVGLRRYDTAHEIEPDRTKAIRKAVSEARPGDIVLIAGKGHETYQILGSETIAFDDREVARTELARLGYQGAV